MLLFSRSTRQSLKSKRLLLIFQFLLIVFTCNTAWAESWLSGTHIAIYNFVNFPAEKPQLIPDTYLQIGQSSFHVNNGANGFSSDPIDANRFISNWKKNIYLVVDDHKLLFGTIVDNGSQGANWLFSFKYHPLNYNHDGTLNLKSPLSSAWSGQCIETEHATNVGLTLDITGSGYARLSDQNSEHTVIHSYNDCPALLDQHTHTPTVTPNFNLNTTYSIDTPEGAVTANETDALTFNINCDKEVTMHIQERSTLDSFADVKFSQPSYSGLGFPRSMPIPELTMTTDCPYNEQVNKLADCNIYLHYHSPTGNQCPTLPNNSQQHESNGTLYLDFNTKSDPLNWHTLYWHMHLFY